MDQLDTDQRTSGRNRYAVMFTASPKVGKQNDPGQANQFSQWFSRTITKLMKKENFVRNLSLLTTDTATALDAIVKRNGGSKTGIFDPFDDLYHIVYQLTMRTVGATEIAESPELLGRTLGLFEEVERNTSTARIIFPWLPTLGYVRQTIAGGKLYVIFDRIAKERRRTGTTHEDAFQFLMDTGEDIVRILTVSSFSVFICLMQCLRSKHSSLNLARASGAAQHYSALVAAPWPASVAS